MEEKKLIFVVDDDPFILKLVENSLKEEGYEVKGFRYGEECLQALEEEEPDLIVLDYLFASPGREVMNGKEVFSRIRERYPSMPVIMLSGQDSGGVVLELARLGMNDYIIKDESLKDNLLESVKDIFEPIE